jgi:hypothetical protein
MLEEIRGRFTTLGALRWQGGWVSMTTHIAMRSTSMIILLRYLDLRLGSEKSISVKGMAA